MPESWNNNHLLLLVAGVPVNNISNGIAYTIETTPLLIFETAEVIRGPGSALYGTDATNGFVGLHTRPSSNAAPAEAELRFGNAGTRIYDLFASHRFQLFSFVVAYNHWTPLRHLDVRADWYWEKFENQIAFSAVKNFSINMFTRSITGLEAELLFDCPISESNIIGGFFNYTLAHLLDEQVGDPTITPSNQLTWAPQHVFNTGVSFSGHGFAASLQGHYQGEVLRRNSDRFKADGTPTTFSAYRPATVQDWFTLDARASYRVSDWIRLGVQASNLLNTRGYLVKAQNFPFDFQIPGIRVLGSIEVTALASRHL